jgi:hypothetical protein
MISARRDSGKATRTKAPETAEYQGKTSQERAINNSCDSTDVWRSCHEKFQNVYIFFRARFRVTVFGISGELFVINDEVKISELADPVPVRPRGVAGPVLAGPCRRRRGRCSASLLFPRSLVHVPLPAKKIGSQRRFD